MHNHALSSGKSIPAVGDQGARFSERFWDASIRDRERYEGDPCAGARSRLVLQAKLVHLVRLQQTYNAIGSGRAPARYFIAQPVASARTGGDG
jgi:hypothetical protein